MRGMMNIKTLEKNVFKNEKFRLPFELKGILWRSIRIVPEEVIVVVKLSVVLSSAFHSIVHLFSKRDLFAVLYGQIWAVGVYIVKFYTTVHMEVPQYYYCILYTKQAI